MDIDINSTVSIQPETFNVMVIPAEMLIEALDSRQIILHHRVPLVCGNFSRILGSLNRNITTPEVRRGLASFRLMAILDENLHTVLIVEHDPLLYEGSVEMAECEARSLRQTSGVSTIMLYSPTMDLHMQTMAEAARRVFCFHQEDEDSPRDRAGQKSERALTTLGAYP